MTINDVLVTGVGGQGVLLLTDVLVNVFNRTGFDAKKSEVHGMAQRGGSVESHVRKGDRVYSPLIRPGHADVLVAMELVEAVRFSHWVRHGGIIIAADLKILPSTVGAGLASYPDDPATLLRTVARGPVTIIDPALAKEAGNVRALNTVMLGVLSGFMDDIDHNCWIEVLRERVPAKAVEINERAFAIGQQVVSS